MPAEEARSVVRQLANTAVHTDDSPLRANFDLEKPLVLTSLRSYQLFELLEPLRELDSAMADELLETNAELGTAARDYPLGMRSVREAQTKRARGQPTGISGSGGYLFGGSKESIPFLLALADSRRSAEFQPAMNEALRLLQDDLNFNQAIQECWPSTQHLRILLHGIGKSMGEIGATYLDQIPDADIRLYGQIEFAAALANLPPYAGIQLSSPAASRRVKPGRT